MNRNRPSHPVAVVPWRAARRFLIPLCLGLWVAAPSFGAAPPAGSTPAQAAPDQANGALPPFDLNDPARIEKGRKRFAKTCAGYCHGHEGIGGRAPDFKGRTDLSPQAAFTTISNGRQGADVMPPWGSAFSEEEIWELVAYLQYLGRQKVE